MFFNPAAGGVITRVNTVLNTTIYNRFNRWSRRKIWRNMLDVLTSAGHLGGTVSVESTFFKAYRSAAGAPKNTQDQAIGTKSWLGKFEQCDEWIACLNTAKMAVNGRDDEQTTTPES